MTPTTLRFAYKAFLGLSQDQAANAAQAQRERLPTVASLDCKRESQPTPGVLRISTGRKKRRKKENKHRSTFLKKIFISILFASDGGSPGPAGSAPGRRWSRACTCHFAREQEPHPPDTCQAAARTPSGCPPRRPRARDRVSAPPPLRGGGGPRGPRGPQAPLLSPVRPRRDAPGDPAEMRPASPRPSLPFSPARGGRAPHLARGSSSGPLSCAGSSSRGGGGGGGGSAAAALRGALGGMTRCAGRREQAREARGEAGARARRARPVLTRLPLQK